MTTNEIYISQMSSIKFKMSLNTLLIYDITNILFFSEMSIYENLFLTTDFEISKGDVENFSSYVEYKYFRSLIPLIILDYAHTPKLFPSGLENYQIR